jgi:hypothetical protein
MLFPHPRQVPRGWTGQRPSEGGRGLTLEAQR